MFQKVLQVAWLIAVVGLVLVGFSVYKNVEIAKAGVYEPVLSAPSGHVEVDDLGFPFAVCKLRTGEETTFTMDPRTLEIWMDSPESFLADLKDVGGTCEVTVTEGYQAQINSSAGIATSHRFGECRLGNPIECGRFWLNPDTYILKWGANNDSAGFMAKFRER